MFGADGDTPFELTADELAGMGQHLAKVNDSIGHSKELFDYINEGLKKEGIDLTANGEANGLSKGIQNITEELTAISRNVEMNRKSVERIETLFNSVVTSGSNGKRIRI